MFNTKLNDLKTLLENGFEFKVLKAEVDVESGTVIRYLSEFSGVEMISSTTLENAIDVLPIMYEVISAIIEYRDKLELLNYYEKVKFETERLAKITQQNGYDFSGFEYQISQFEDVCNELRAELEDLLNNLKDTLYF